MDTISDIAAEDSSHCVGGNGTGHDGKGMRREVDSKRKISVPPTEQRSVAKSRGSVFIAQAQYESIGGEQQRPEQHNLMPDHSTELIRTGRSRLCGKNVAWRNRAEGADDSRPTSSTAAKVAMPRAGSSPIRPNLGEACGSELLPTDARRQPAPAATHSARKHGSGRSAQRSRRETSRRSTPKRAAVRNYRISACGEPLLIFSETSLRGNCHNASHAL